MTRPSSNLVLRPAERVLYGERLVEIEAILGLDTVRVKDSISGLSREASIAELAPLPRDSNADGSNGSDPPAEVSKETEFRFSVIDPLLVKIGRTRADVEKRAAEFGYTANTLYKWIGLYANGALSSLSRRERSDKGKKLLDPQVESILATTLANLETQDRSTTKIHKDIEETITTRNAEEIKKARQGTNALDAPTTFTLLQVPSLSTIRNRLQEIPPRKRHARLYGSQAAAQRYDPILGSFPDANWPLAVVQIDHVLLDLIVVDQVARQPIGRPWLTLMFDVFSRMVTGFYVSLDPPGAMSTGLCIAHSILPKEEWLLRIGSTATWAVWGEADAIHGDNAFRIEMLQDSCHKRKINLIWRPIKKPRFGGHIERWVGTLGQAIHYLPGTTFSNTKERGNYDSDKNACFTLSELELWLVEKIAAYHVEPHSQIEMSPLERYRIGVLKGAPGHPAVGLRPRIVDPHAQILLQLDLMPVVRRTVQRYGVELNKIFYYGDELRGWIDANDPEHPKLKRLFEFRRFYRDISSIWFHDPKVDDYFEIPTRDSTFPAMSIWELHKLRRDAKRDGVKNSDIDEEYIKARYARMRDIEDQAVKKTKAARRQEERRREWDAAPRPRLTVDLPDKFADWGKDVPYERVRGFTDDD